MRFLLFAGSAWTDRHQSLVLLCVVALVLIGSAL